MDPAPDLNIIDRFLAAFSQYIDSGFGLLGGDVAFLTTILIGLDITLAGLWWAMDADKDVLGRFLKKILYVGIFAFILGNFQQLGDIVFRSFAGLGLTAGGGTIGPDDLLKPGKLAAVGFDAAKPMLTAIKDMLGFPAFFGNALSILVLFVAWLVVVLAFFILAIQLFLTIIEFKLTTLAGFVLVPFALFNKTSFLAERVLGNVVSSGLKVMVLAVIVGIGGGFFEMFLSAGTGEPDVASAMTLVLAALSLLGLAIFGPGVPPASCPARRNSGRARRSARSRVPLSSEPAAPRSAHGRSALRRPAAWRAFAREPQWARRLAPLTNSVRTPPESPPSERARQASLAPRRER